MIRELKDAVARGTRTRTNSIGEQFEELDREGAKQGESGGRDTSKRGKEQKVKCLKQYGKLVGTARQQQATSARHCLRNDMSPHC